MILLARNPQAARELKEFLRKHNPAAGGSVYAWKIAGDGMRVVRS